MLSKSAGLSSGFHIGFDYCSVDLQCSRHQPSSLYLVDSSKNEGPACCVTFLGIVIDTGAFELQLLVEKIGSAIVKVFQEVMH